MWGVYEEGELGGQVQIMGFESYIHGRWLEMGGIGGVGTWGEYRGKGWVGGVLKDGLEEMKRKKESISFLDRF
ncbi:GNAT family N-acetyltransferase, partial [Paenibacillus xylanexedens]|uniref:GNAT family N-acetyltransferase n=1 Tax=Paenibacillus xylanexedens TaxID=528191 RepID=UPI0021B28E51